jgi:hypothetical protein
MKKVPVRYSADRVADGLQCANYDSASICCVWVVPDYFRGDCFCSSSERRFFPCCDSAYGME